jgi:hypothetical protein
MTKVGALLHLHLECLPMICREKEAVACSPVTIHKTTITYIDYLTYQVLIYAHAMYWYDRAELDPKPLATPALSRSRTGLACAPPV